MLPLSQDSRVLDAGCGWGTLTFQLAKSYKHVWAFDRSDCGTEFIKIRSKQDKVDNIIPVRGNVLKLPFCDNYFDLVVLNGVLEWIGQDDESLDPLIVQQRLLKEFFRVLKPKGYLYVGIENRWSATYFLGEPEGHVNLRFISLLPRFTARAYHRIVKKTPYSVYTHSKRNYVRMFKKAGFNGVSAYSPIPQYHHYSNMVPLDNFYACKYYVDKLFSHKKKLAVFFNKIVKAFYLYRLMPFFAPCFSFIVAKSDKDPVSALLSQDLGEKFLGQKRKASFILNSSTNHIVLIPFIAKAKQPLFILKTCRYVDNDSFTKLDDVYKYLKELNSDFINKSIPDIIYAGKFWNRQVIIERAVTGKNIDSFVKRGINIAANKHNAKNIKIVLDWITKFNQVTKNSEIKISQESLNNYILPVKEAIERAIAPELKEQALKRVNELEDSSLGKAMPLVFQHRDFGPSNILLDGATVKVFDWELSQKSAEPLYDVFYFISRYCYLMYYDPNKHGVPYFHTLAQYTEKTFFQGSGFMHELLSSQIKQYCQSLNIDINLAKILFLWQQAGKNNNPGIVDLFFSKEDRFIL
ncbi:MAG: methyltransferase domain-containing protein [Candidatus Omnitrophica bacterium]|nr:methyltransferase domain-containing protein [Candidatus Omnitrophota bacterium]